MLTSPEACALGSSQSPMDMRIAVIGRALWWLINGCHLTFLPVVAWPQSAFE
ncbi:hypothetical protein D3C79_589420 [compost metagenome]